MKKILVAASLVAFAAPAFANESSKVDCSELSGSPYICVHNLTDQAIKKIHCPGWWTNAQNIPGGVIDPGTTTVVKFTSSKCDAGLIVTLGDDHEKKFEGFDTSKNTDLKVK